MTPKVDPSHGPVEQLDWDADDQSLLWATLLATPAQRLASATSGVTSCSVRWPPFLSRHRRIRSGRACHRTSGFFHRNAQDKT